MKSIVLLLGVLIICATAKADLSVTNQVQFESLRTKAEGGNAEAEFDLGRCYQNGLWVTQDRKEALKWYEKSAMQGHPRAEVLAGMCYFYGWDVKVDKARGLKLFHEAAEQEDPGAFACLCLAYYQGDDVQQDFVQSYKWCWLFMKSDSDIYSEDELARMVMVEGDLKGRLTHKQIRDAVRLAKQERKQFKKPRFYGGS